MNRIRLCLISLLFSTVQIKAEALRQNIPDPATISAYQQFWRTFEDYDSHHRSLEEGKNFGAWDQIKSEWGYQDIQQRDTQLEILEEASRRYQDHLEEHPEASNTPYVKLNLAQIFNIMGQLQEEKSEGSGQPIRRKALALLADLTKTHPSFDQMEETEYLRASILESLGQSETAYPIWKRLSEKARSTLFGVHASLAVGDYSFAKERPKEALTAYRRGESLLKGLDVKDKDFELLRLQYRIVWAAYRAAELEVCIEMSQQLLEPGRSFHQLSVKRRIEQDASELMGDALFELDRMRETKAVLQKNMIRPFAGTIGLRIVSRLRSMPTKDRLLEIGQFLVEHYPQAREMPDILLLLADAYKEERREEDYLATWERLSLMLSPTSLWRAQHQAYPDAIKSMEEKALAATQLLAQTYYEQGMTQDKAIAFRTATTYYDTLLRFDPQNKESENWQLRRAHSLYFGGQLTLADQAYEEFKQRKVSPQNLELAYYHQSLVREKLWRESLQKSLTGRGDPQKDPIVVERLRRLEQTIDAFADRFPNRPYTNDLLLLAASANRDVNDFKQAEKYWNRTLLSEPSAAQRTLAIRGLVQARIRTGQAHEVLELVRNYLKLENWQELGTEFREELHSILSVAARDASEDLNKKGQVAEAGTLLLKVCDEFPAVPDRDTIYRDGAFLLAIAGQWIHAYRAADSYLTARGPKRREADMLYLKARSLEYQLHFATAAQNYLSLGQRFPQYPKTGESLKRAEDLARAEEDFETAGQAALISLNLAKDDTIRKDALLRAADAFTQAKSWEEALSALQKSQKLARQVGSKLQIKLLTARLHAAKGDLTTALQLFREIAQEANQKQENMDLDTYRSLAGEAYFQLAESERRNYEAFELDESSELAPKVQAKGLRLEKCLEAYNKAIQTQDPQWASRSRYGAGQAADNMAQVVKSSVARSKYPIPESEAGRLKDQAQRWQGLAQQYFSQNLMARQKEPHRYKDSLWIERSAMKVAGYKAKDTDQGLTSAVEIPTSLGPSQPYQWSH